MKSVRLFFLIFIPLSVLLEFFAIRSGLSGASVTLLMWSPGFAAMATLKLRRIPLSELGWQWGPARAHALALGLPVIYGGTACLLAHLLGLADFATPQARAAFVENGPFASLGPAWAALPMTVLTLFAATTLTAMARALGEEIGWRGFLTPKLASSLGFAPASLLTGLVWAVWHMPVMWLSGYNGGGDRFWETVAFLLNVLSISGIFTWLWLKTGSLWPATTLHAAHNVFIQVILNPLSTRGEGAITIVGEFGILLALVTAAVSIPFWVRGMRESPFRTKDTSGHILHSEPQ